MYIFHILCKNSVEKKYASCIYFMQGHRKRGVYFKAPALPPQAVCPLLSHSHTVAPTAASVLTACFKTHHMNA